MIRRDLLRTLSPALLAQAGRGKASLARFDELMHAILRDQRLPGGSLSLAKDGHLVYARGFGLAIVEGRVPIRPTTMFGLASVSKLITAVGILKLADQGKLRLDDHTFDFLGDLKPSPGQHVDPRTRRITLRQLLNHSGGYTQQPDEMELHKWLGMPKGKVHEDDVVRAFMGHRLDFDPGTRHAYSNFGFVLLGAVLARVVGLPYGPVVHRLVFSHMGIERPHVGHGGPEQPDTARPYDEQGRPMPPINISGAPAGGWVASTVDLVRFLSAINTHYLSREIMDEMLRPPEARHGDVWFGLGWDAVRQTPGGPSYMKNGGMSDVRAAIGHLPGSVDWAVAFNGGRDVKARIDVDAEAVKLIHEAVEQTVE